MDKEALIKNRFWIMLGGVGVLVLLAWVTLLVAGSDDKQQKKYESAFKTIEADSKKTPKTEQYRAPWEKYRQGYAEQKNGVWEQAWKGQEKIYGWPWDAVAEFQKIEYYGQDVGPDSDPARKHYAADLYPKQFKSLPEKVAPVEFLGGVDGFNSMMVPATSSGAASGGGFGPGFGGGGTSGDNRRPGGPGGAGGAAVGGAGVDSFWPKDSAPTMEEIWLAQEDFWVKSAMLDIVRETLDKYARFVPVDVKDEPLPDKIVQRWRFRNPSWEITLLIEEGMSNGRPATFISPRSTIKNVNATQRTQQVANARTGKGLKFQLVQNGATYKFEVEGEPLAFNSSIEFKKPIQFDVLKMKEPFEMSQVLEWATSPVRRIDELKTAKNSHRLAFKALKFNPQLYDPTKEPAPAPTIGGGRGGAGGGSSGPGETGSGGGGGAGRGTEPAGTPATPLGLERDRYILTNDQCRHLPIGMVLVVDQAAINDVLIAVANSPLRIQVTQVHLLHVHDSGPPDLSSPSSDQPGPGSGPGSPGGAGPGFPGGAGRGKPGGGFPAGGGSSYGPGGGPGRPGGGAPGPGGGLPGPGGAGATTTDAGPEDDNLFELTVYGVATLYERYPPQDPKDKEKDKEKGGTPVKTPTRP